MVMKLFAACLFAIGATTAASSATIYATGVTWGGTTVIGSARQDPGNALGAPDGKFLSLGLGGRADFTFGTDFTSPGEAFEVTWGNRAGYVETANIFVGANGDFDFVQAINNSTGSAITFNFAGRFDTLRIVDTSAVINRRDGFDVDAVGVTAVFDAPGIAAIPLPATVLLLAAGVGALAALCRARG